MDAKSCRVYKLKNIDILNQRFENITFKIITKPEQTLPPDLYEKYCKQINNLFVIRKWKIKLNEIKKSMKHAGYLVLAFDGDNITGAFFININSLQPLGKFYYLGKMIIGNTTDIWILFLLAFLFIMSLNDFGKKAITFAGITCQKVISDLFSLFNQKDVFISNKDWNKLSTAGKNHINEIIKICKPSLARPGEFILNHEGLITNLYTDNYGPPGASYPHRKTIAKNAVFLKAQLPKELKTIYKNYLHNFKHKYLLLDVIFKSIKTGGIFTEYTPINDRE